jgi:hypothetical protein
MSESKSSWSAPFRFVAADQRLPLACGAAIALAALFVIPYRISQSGYLTDVSGAWATLADDVAHGVLYRPLVSDLGYGGTRYFPLEFTLHGLLVYLGIPLRPAGHLLSLLSAGTLVAAGVLGLLRRGAPRTLSLAAGALTLASRSAFMGAAGIRGDILPVALGVLGLALVPRKRSESFVPAAICLALSVLAKPTLIWAPAGAFIALALSGEVRRAFLLEALAGAITLSGLAVAHLVSHGEMLPSFQACASGGGFSLSILLGSFNLVRPGELGWIVSGIGLTLFRGRRAFEHPFCAALLCCVPTTLLLYTSRGMHVNHLIDLASLGALAVGAAVAELGDRRWPRFVLAAATTLGVAEAVLLDGMVLRRGELERAAAAIPTGPGPILSEQPWIPLLAGERAVLLDAYALVLTRRVSPSLERDLFGRLDQRSFRAVVLIGRAETAGVWYDDIRFGPGFKQHLLANYAYRGVAGAHAIYLPRAADGAAPGLRVQADPEGEADTVLNRGGRPNAVRRFLQRLLGR